MNRRHFLKTCGQAALLAGTGPGLLSRAHGQPVTAFERVRLVNGDGSPFKVSAFGPDEFRLFYYPYRSTPCLLIRLGQAKAEPRRLSTAAGEEYEWKGGVGPENSIVAYSAICAHQLAYAKPDAAILSYNPKKSEMAGRSGVISCCAHASMYDPAHGAQVIGGPASGPLAAIALEYDASQDALWAVGVHGGALFQDFFKAYRGDLNATYGPGRYREPVTATTPVIKVEMAITC